MWSDWASPPERSGRSVCGSPSMAIGRGGDSFHNSETGSKWRPRRTGCKRLSCCQEESQRRMMTGFWWAAVFIEVLAIQILATVGSNIPQATTAELGLFNRIFHAAKGLVWSSNADATEPTATTLPMLPRSTAASAEPRVQLLQAAQASDAKMNFSLRVLNEDFSVAAEPGEYVEGALIHLEARVQASPGLSPKLFVDECYGKDVGNHGHFRRIYILADKHGCLYGDGPKVRWLRREDPAMVFTIPAFLLTGDSEEIYIHCLLSAWSRETSSSLGKKACYFDSISSSWKNIDDPSKNYVCKCCNSHCPWEPPSPGSEKAFWGEGKLHSRVVGPLRVHKEDVPWFEGRCHTMKTFLLVSISFGGSCVLAVLFTGATVALGLAVFRYSRTSKGHKLLKNRKEHQFQTELQLVLGDLAVDEEVEKESNVDYCKIKSDTPEEA
ncbi:zona pellucida sperm-binding protein 3 [Zootoca vivipara]|uniref:zona pellucida sperm-binding protein 3 n=1 Tax=Zootoca vivipara TaxID=8524 RepID=UPI00293B873F|nr:zona pellucida sperm-binding protein 3 [Zootoca vivipara]XP_060125249.1 zona pellucida sperm-binding protein 3 [Zootoca vivipara]